MPRTSLSRPAISSQLTTPLCRTLGLIVVDMVTHFLYTHIMSILSLMSIANETPQGQQSTIVREKPHTSRDSTLDLGDPTAPPPKGLKALLQCLARYVEANSQRFAYREERLASGHVFTVVLRRENET
jgi:hypothetical protein